MRVSSYARFDATPPRKAPPPSDCVDLAYNGTTGVFTVQHPDNSTKTLTFLEDGSQGGNGADDEGKVVLFNGEGSLRASSFEVISTEWETEPESAIGLGYQSLVIADGATGKTVSLFVDGNTISSSRLYAMPDANGTLGVLRSYADSTAANAAVSVGDAWWDTTLKKVRVRLT